VGVGILIEQKKIRLYMMVFTGVVLSVILSMTGGILSVLSVLLAAGIIWYQLDKYHKSIELELKDQLIDEVKRVNACEERFEDVIEYSTDISHFRDVFDEATQFIVVFSLEGTLLYANKAICDFAGTEENELIGKPYWELPWLVHSEQLQNRMVFSFEQAFRGEPVRFEATYLDAEHKESEIDFVVKPILDEHDDVNLLIAMGYNITDLVHTREALTEKERQMNALFEFAMDGHFFYMMPEPVSNETIESEGAHELAKHHKFKRWNKALLGHFGIQLESLEALSLAEVMDLGDDAVANICESLFSDGKFHNKIEIFNSKIEMNRIIEIIIIAIRNTSEEYTGCFGVTRDITDQKHYEQKLEYLAHKDALTGLDNRRSFFEKSAELMADASCCPVVLMADIDRFKVVNDTYGHDAGDIVLKKIAEQMEISIGESGFISRYGGEEFVVVFSAFNTEEANHAAERLRDSIEKLEIELDNNNLQVTVSIGISQVFNNEVNVESAITRADGALYEAKKTGRNRVVTNVKS